MAAKKETAKLLPRFEGRNVTSQRFIQSGSHLVAGENHDPHGIGDRMIVLSEVEVIGVNHKEMADGELRRIETVTVRRYAWLDEGTGNTLATKHLPAKPPPEGQESLLDGDED